LLHAENDIINFSGLIYLISNIQNSVKKTYESTYQLDCRLCDGDCDDDGDGYWKNDDGDVEIPISGIQIQDLCDYETLN
jgi:hypothetical protein